MSKRITHSELPGPYIKTDLPNSVCRWIRFCENIHSNRKISEQVKLDILRRIHTRIELHGKFVDWRNTCRCNILLRRNLLKRYFRYFRFTAMLNMNKLVLERLFSYKCRLLENTLFHRWLKVTLIRKAILFQHRKSLRSGWHQLRLTIISKVKKTTIKYFHRWILHASCIRKLNRLKVKYK